MRTHDRFNPINAPLVETRMVSAFQGQGISFRTEGRVLTLPSPSR